MKITGIRILRLARELDPPFHAAWDPTPRRTFEATLVFVETSEGITGVGSGDTMAGFEGYEHLFVGEDPLAMVRHVRAIESINFHAGRYWPLEAALWDIAGQVCGQPVATLFGGAVKRVPAYASCGELKPPEERAEVALALREEGFRAMKIRVDPERLEEGIASVRAAREAVGSSMEIMVDLNQAWRMAGDARRSIDPVTAREIAGRLRDLDVFWLEEPLDASDAKGLADLRAASGVRIAGGEMARTVPELLAYIEADSLDVYQPDVVLAVGMMRARTVAELAMARNRHFTPHTWTNGIGVLANLHVTAGVSGGPYLEFPYDPPGWTPERRDFMLAEPLRIDAGGCLNVPDLPGLGVVLDEDVLRGLGKVTG
ncbi:MAG TPA: mandelate racemase/muconate lactonizing enzyme family protein [Rubrobacteraceae bacterium]|nr:mandelate racemase/muconate lactonizing enzyme family protein [Rubrobacteraceae bacterium]